MSCSLETRYFTAFQAVAMAAGAAFFIYALVIDRQRKIFRYTPSIWPCKGIISSSYGKRVHPIFGNKIFHPAIDIANDKNTTLTINKLMISQTE